MATPSRFTASPGRWRRAFGRWAVALIAGSIAAAAAPQDADDDVVVTGQGGPALWHVLGPGSDVVIVGTVAPLAAGLRWSHWRLEAAITGARRVILSPEPSSGLVWSEHFTQAKIDTLRLPEGTTVKGVLPPDLRDRYDADLKLGRQSAAELNHWNLVLAGSIVLNRARAALKLTTAEPDATIRQLADRHGVRIEQLLRRAGLPTLDRVPGLGMADQIACLGEHMDDIDREQATADAVSQAWARGDLPALRLHYRRPQMCEDVIKGDNGYRALAVEEAVASVRRDLSLPGRSVLAIDVSVVLDPAFQRQLVATGATLRAPRE